MEKLSLFILENIKILILILVILCGICPMIYRSVKRNKRKKKRDILDKKSIITDTNIMDRILAILVFGVLIIVGIILIYFSITKTEIRFNMITGIITGGLMWLLSAIFIIKTLSETIKILTGQYLIVIDKLLEKNYQSNTIEIDGSRENNSYWKLYFKDFSKKYDTHIRYNSIGRGKKFDIGDEFYLVFVKGNGTVPYVYPVQEYKLEESQKSKIKTLEEAEKYIK